MYRRGLPVIGRLILVVSAMLVHEVALAQQSDSANASEAEIIVEREREIDMRAAGELARALAGGSTSREPLGRFEKPLCLQIVTDDTSRGFAIGYRIIANARAFGVTVAKPGCRFNALLIIADDMREKIDGYRRSGHRFFTRWKPHEIDRALNVRDPVYVFQDTSRTVAVARGRLDRAVRNETIASAVMVENRAIAGFSPEQVGDCASMRLLSPARELDLMADSAPRTIMTLFLKPDAAPRELTPFDRAYLGAL